MKVSELRVGNIIFASFNDPLKESEQITVSGVSMPDKYVYGHFDSPYTINNCSGIPLTEEWLLKFGFEKIDLANQGFNNMYNLGDFYIEADYSEFNVWKPDGDNSAVKLFWMPIKRIGYVHQLQNIHFVIRDEELTIK